MIISTVAWLLSAYLIFQGISLASSYAKPDKLFALSVSDIQFTLSFALLSSIIWLPIVYQSGKTAKIQGKIKAAGFVAFCFTAFMLAVGGIMWVSCKI